MPCPVAVVSLGALLAAGFQQPGEGRGRVEELSGDVVPAVVRRHCADCHTGADAEKGFDVESLFAGQRADDETRRDRATLAFAMVRSRTMPPPDESEQPDGDARRELAAALAQLVPSPAGERIAVARRLSRDEYARTIADLCGVDCGDRDRLPEDVRIHGFDDLGDAAGVAPAQFEQWFDLAAAIAVRMQAAQRPKAIVDARVPLAASLPPFLGRAFRRPPTEAELQARERLHARVLADGGDEGEARRAVVRSVLASPAFLLRTEFGRDDEPDRLSSHELAVRLSYLLTGSMPDDELATAAFTGELASPACLQRHARRLLARDGGRAFSTRFVAQWLRAVDVPSANADFRRYPQIWNQRLRPAFVEEVVRLGAEIARENGPVRWFVDCDHAWLDENLCELYGLPAPEKQGFARVALADRRRGGVLGSGAMAITSSYPLRTSPVLRGTWVLDVLLDARTPPPPPGAGALPADDEPKGGASLRTQLEAHRRLSKCASCHARIDPLGFALENFDVLGRWRDELHGQPVDARGELPDGTAIDGVVALKDELLRREDEFVRAFTSRLAVFAVGRAMVPNDEPELQRIAARCLAGGGRFLPLLDALLASPLFLLRDPGGLR